MDYTSFLKLLDELKQIRSFAGKKKFADYHFQKIGSGSGRAVYDIDGNRVLKLAKNPKGIAQNEEETRVSGYYDTKDIVTEIFDYAEDYSYVIAEKAKKVSEARIKAITGIPSLYEMYYYLRNVQDNSRGKRSFFHVDPELQQKFDDNEFVQDLAYIVTGYEQSAGDMSRASTFGEVNRNGQPQIVLTDYGLSDEVYNTHYNPERKQKYQMYELFNYADGNDDILSDANGGGDIRNGIFAQIPYGVGDGDGVVNEQFIDFVTNREYYPSKPMESMPILVENFHECVNNLKGYVNKAKNKKRFYENLLKLQEYLIRQKFYDRDPIGVHEFVTEEEQHQLQPQSGEPQFDRSLFDNKEYADKVANEIAAKLNLTHPNFLGGGAWGKAYEINNEIVLKVTSDIAEADAAVKTIVGNPQYLAKIFKIYKVIDTEVNKAFFAITQENIKDKPTQLFYKYNDTIDTVMPADYAFTDFLINMRKRKITPDEMRELAKRVLTDNPQAIVQEQDRKEAYYYLLGLANIYEELIKFGIKSSDYGEPKNLGYKNGVLKYFDVGGYKAEEPALPQNSTVYLPEDGSAKFSTDQAMGQDEFPAYNQDVLDPSIENDLHANSSLYEDLEYHHADDATKDTFQLDEGEGVDYYLHGITKQASPREGDPVEQVNLAKRIAKEIYQKFLLLKKAYFDNDKAAYKANMIAILQYIRQEGFKFQQNVLINPVDALQQMFTVLGFLKEEDKPEHFETMDKVLNILMNDQQSVNERVQTFMPDSKGVEVKKKCRLAGNGNTSEPCNQGDINNLNIKPLQEANEYQNYNKEKSQLDSKENQMFRRLDKLHADTELKYLKPYLTPEEEKIVYEDLIDSRRAAEFSGEERKHKLELSQKSYEIRNRVWKVFAENDPEGYKKHSAESGQYITTFNKLQKYFSKKNIELNRKYNNSDEIYGMGGDVNVNEISHFTVVDSAINIIDDGYFMEGDDGGVAFTSNKNLVKQRKPVFYYPQSWGYEGKTHKNLSTQFILDFNKMKQDKLRFKRGNENIGTHYGEEEIRVYPKNGELLLQPYLKKVIIDTSKEKNKETIKKLVELLKNKSIPYYLKGGINETVNVNIPQKLTGYDSIKIMNDGQEVGELGIIDRGIFGKNHYIVIDKIFIYKNFRGYGFANDAMRLLFNYADKNNIIITLTPDNIWGASVPKLKNWYKSLGFIMNKGQKKDFYTMQLMYRLPKSLQESVFTGFWDDQEFLNEDEVNMNQLNRGVGKDEMVQVNDFPLNKLSVSKRGMANAITDIKQGRPSQTNEPVLVFYNIDKQLYLVEDGYHRVAQAYLNKEKTIPVQIYSDRWSDYVANVYPENKFMLGEENQVSGEENIKRLLPNLIQAAQKVYDEWDQDENGNCEWLGAGGICQDIADAICSVLSGAGIECSPVSQQIGEQHVYTVAKLNDGVFEIDIPPYVYETGGGYCWKKIQDVKFSASHFIINRLTSDPNEFDNYIMDESLLKESFNLNEQIMSIDELPFKNDVILHGGKIYSVGGAVRDSFLGKESKDLDILITGIPMDELEQILSKHGRVDAVGKSFGILKFKYNGSTEDIDIAIPREDKVMSKERIEIDVNSIRDQIANIESGRFEVLNNDKENVLKNLKQKLKDLGNAHKTFDTTYDSNIPIEKDLERRDFTINAIAKDINGNIVDPYGGQKDLKDKIIRVVNPQAFSDDPLRMLRAVQFASRFGFEIEPNTMKMIQDNASRIKEIPPERILTEFDKIINKGNPSIGAQLLIQTGLFQQIFGKPKKISSLFSNVKTMGEFIFLLSTDGNPAEFYKNILKGDIDTYKEIKALDLAYDNAESISTVEARSIAHNMYVLSPKTLNSGIIPHVIKIAAQDLLSGKYPKTIGELAVNGNDLMELGLKGKQIGDTLKSLLLKVYSDKIPNQKEELLNSLNQNGMIKEAASKQVEYGCLMLFLDVPVWEKITSIIQPEDLYVKDGEYGIEKEPHCTILYGFHDEVNAEDVFDLVKKNMPLKPIEIRVKGISMFENNDFDVVKFDVNSDELKRLNGIMKQLPNTNEFPEYHAHITIAYVKKGEGKKYIKPFEKERVLKGNELVYTWKGHKGKDGETLMLNEFSYPEANQDIYNPVWNVGDQEVSLPYFIKKYDEWNTQNGTEAYAEPSTVSVTEFLENNFQDLSQDMSLRKKLLVALNDRDILN